MLAYNMPKIIMIEEKHLDEVRPTTAPPPPHAPPPTFDESSTPTRAQNTSLWASLCLML